MTVPLMKTASIIWLVFLLRILEGPFSNTVSEIAILIDGFLGFH